MSEETRASGVAERMRPFGTTIFAEMTALANRHGAVNLSQGFPDFDGPEFVREAAARAMAEGRNQYAPLPGTPELRAAIRGWYGRGGMDVDPDREVTVTAGCTEALAAAFLGIVNPGDEVVVFEPFYDSYRACLAMAGAVGKWVTLRPGADGRFGFDEAELRAAFGPKTRAVLVNTPHNPTGKVFARAELELIRDLCVEHDAIAIVDEVYECLTYDEGLPHVRLAMIDGMRERSLTLSSLGKTFSLTGWKIGWAVGPAALTAGVRSAHQFLTFTVATPLQIGAAAALDEGEESVRELRAHYSAMRGLLGESLVRCGLTVLMPEGSYFIMVDHTAVSARLGLADDVAFCRYLTETVGVAAIPPSAFYADPARGAAFARFAFCKTEETMRAGIERLERELGAS